MARISRKELNEKMDSRLRRLVTSLEDKERLGQDLARSLVFSHEPFVPGEPVEPEVLTKKVMVMLRSPEIPAEISGFKWINIVGNFYSIEAPIQKLNELAALHEVEFVEAGRDLFPGLDSSVPETKADIVWDPRNGDPGFSGEGVVVGIIDFGFDFTLDDFRNQDGSTRVEYIWDQSLQPYPNEQSPHNFPYGVEYNAADINQALNSPDPFSYVRHKPNPGSHGTHVAGIACGNGRSGDANYPSDQYVGVACDATIIFVQPETLDEDDTFTDSVRVAEAIAYIFNRADQLGKPCVINMSLGQNGGSHDGESVVERAIDRLLEVPRRAFVVAAGNEHIWRGHASGTLGTNETRTLRWRVGGGLPLPDGGTLQPGVGDFTHNEMEIWYSSRDRFRVTVRDPSGESTATVDPGETEFHTFNSGDQVFIDSRRFTRLNGDAQIYIEMSPPSFLQSTLTSGIWEVELVALDSHDGRFDAWIERDWRRPSNNFADQSFFVGTDFDGSMTLGTPATTRHGIAVANYDHVAETPSHSSGRGRTRDGRDKPEVAAPGTNIVSSGAMGGKQDPDSPTIEVFPMRVIMSGTSMSAPHVAGIVALMMHKNGELTAEQIRKMLIAAAKPAVGISPFDLAWGFGKVDAAAAVELID